MSLIDLPIDYIIFYGYKRGWHLAYYIPKNSGNSDHRVYSNEILKFKDGDRESVKNWSLWATKELKELGINFHYVVRALSSDEMEVSGDKGLDKLGRHLEKCFGWKYCPSVLVKTRFCEQMKGKKKMDRELNVKDLYSIGDSRFDFNYKNILVLDDITTSGTTAGALAHTLKSRWPKGEYYFFCMSKTKKDPTANSSILENFVDQLPF